VKRRRGFTAALVAASAAFAPIASQASDMAELGHPALLRSMIMGMKQRRAIRCLERWTQSGERERLAPLAEEIVRRTEISIGFPNIVRAALRFEEVPSEYRVTISDKSYEPAPPILAKVAPSPMPAECSLLAARFDQVGLEAAAALLGPAPVRPIPLPSAGTCVAYLKFNHQFWALDMSGFLASVRQAPEAKLPADERAAILRDVAAFNQNSEITFGDPAQTQSLASNEFGAMFCFGAVVDVMMRLGRPVDMNDSHVRLFFNDGDLLNDIDAEIAAHPEWLNDPAHREGLGVIGDPPPS
jgi:hypothetical protein